MIRLVPSNSNRKVTQPSCPFGGRFGRPSLHPAAPLAPQHLEALQKHLSKSHALYECCQHQVCFLGRWVVLHILRACTLKVICKCVLGRPGIYDERLSCGSIYLWLWLRIPTLRHSNGGWLMRGEDSFDQLLVLDRSRVRQTHHRLR